MAKATEQRKVNILVFGDPDDKHLFLDGDAYPYSSELPKDALIEIANHIVDGWQKSDQHEEWTYKEVVQEMERRGHLRLLDIKTDFAVVWR